MRVLLPPSLVLLIALLPATAGGRETGGPPDIYTVIVANNHSVKPGLAGLRYADDDGAKFFEFFSSVGRMTTLLTVLDAATQAQFPGLAAVAVPPRRGAIQAALRRTFDAIRRAGRPTVFYFVYSGHGGVDASGQGYVHLLDGVMTRADLFQDVVRPSPAAFNHLIVDACDAYHLVRGKGEWRDDKAPVDYSDQLRRFLGNETLESHPNTGVLLATSRAADTHEWSRLEGGIFSHQVRSALAGAADITGDGKVSYSEVAAYVAAANSLVTNRSARVSIYARPPAQDLDQPVIRLDGPSLFRVEVARSLHGHFYFEDRRGVRYADFNKSNEQSLTLVLAPGPGLYYLRGPEAEVRLEFGPSPRTILVSQLAPRTLVVRGAMGEALEQGLYALPFGRSFHEGFVAAWRRSLQEAAEPASEPSPLLRWRLGAGYLLTTPVLDRGGLAHGVSLHLLRRIWRWLEGGVDLEYGLAAESGWRQHRASATALLGARLDAWPWLTVAADVGLGYLGIVEIGQPEARGDLGAVSASFGGSVEGRLAPHLWGSLRGRLLIDSFSTDEGRRVRAAPALTVGLTAAF